MPGLNLKQGGGLGSMFVAAAPMVTPTTTAAAVASYGPGAGVVVDNGPGVIGTNPGQLAVYAGIAALAGLLLIRHSLPK